MDVDGGIVVAVLDEGSSTSQSMPVSASLAIALARAARLNEGWEQFPISFKSLLIGLLTAPDATGEWLRARYKQNQEGIDGLLKERRLDWASLQSLAAADTAEDLRFAKTATALRRTVSAARALDEAARHARADGRPADTADLLQAMLTLPDFHEREFERYRIDRTEWSQAFAGAGADTDAGQHSQAQPSRDPSSQSDWAFDSNAAGVERHVLLALQQAEVLAADDPIGPAHVIAAVGQIAPTVGSRAFTRLAQLVPQETPVKTTLTAAPEATRLDPELRQQLSWAQRPAQAGGDPTPVWGRDLVTAGLLCADDRVGPAIAAAGGDLATVRARWYAFIVGEPAHRDSAAWAEWWRAAGVPLPGPRRAGYALDTDKGEDKLNVRQEAHAFARLILDKDVHPPLSIGLLGDWGSGKSFFIEQIKKEIADLKEQDRPELHKHVVEIEFNAWHASDANLWASLVTEIFDKIWDNVRPVDETRDPARARAQLRQRIKEARGAVHEAETQVQLGEEALKLAESELKKKCETLALDRYVESVALANLEELAKAAGWHQPLGTIKDVEHAMRELAASGNRLRTLAGVLLEGPLQNIAVPAFVVLAVTAGVWALVDLGAWPAWQEAASKTLAAVAGFVGTLITPLRLARDRVDKLANMLTQVREEYDGQLAQVRERDPKRAEVVDRARRELESAQASVAAARGRLAELLNQQAALEPMQRLGTFLHERVQSTQYRSQQGIISLVHKDFSELSRYMKDLRDAAAEEGAAEVDRDAIRPVDRIVLYVDDLDRCRPEHVVNMLEAVHLLLALDLFVVIVAVDSRWLARSLEVYYSELLGEVDVEEHDGLRASTPQNYLEKIFQITYALAPMDPNYFGDYVAFLTQDTSARKTTAAAGATAAAAGATGPAPPPTLGPGTAVAALAQSKEAPAPTARAPAPNAPPPTVRAPSPSLPVQFSKVERGFITRLVPLLPTPRIAKRLVNVYRVIKAGKSAEQLEVFELEGRVTPCLLMLAVLFGRPLIAGELLRALHDGTAPFHARDKSLVQALRNRKPAPNEGTTIRVAWKRLIETLDAIGIETTVGECAREAREVARFSLVTGHAWHTWSSVPLAVTTASRATSPPQ